MGERYTESASEVLRDAKLVAENLSHSYVGTEHLLIGLIHTKGTASVILRENGVEERKLMDLVRTLIAPENVLERPEKQEFTPRARRVLEHAAEEAAFFGQKMIGTEHLLLGLFVETDCSAMRLLNTMNVNLQKVLQSRYLL